MPQFDAVAGGVADLRSGIGLADSWAPDDVDAFGLQIIGSVLRVVDFEGNHSVAEMLALRRGFDDSALVRDQLDGGTAEFQIYEVDRCTQPLSFFSALNARAAAIAGY